MTTPPELSRRLVAWFAARRRVREWIDHHALADGNTGIPEELRALRHRAYDLEWALLNESASKDTWDNALMLAQPDEEEGLAAVDLRKSLEAIEILPPTSASGERGLAYARWWFVPMATWIGRASTLPGAPKFDHANPALLGIRDTFQKQLQASIQEFMDEAREGMGDTWRFSLHLTPFLNPEGLRKGAFLPGDYDSWGVRDKQPFAIHHPPEEPILSACMGIYLATPDYRSLASVRDILLELIDRDSEEMSGENLRMGPMLDRVAAVREAELLQWELWSEEILDTPLTPGASNRQVMLLVSRHEGQPVLLEARCLDLDAAQVVRREVGTRACRLDRDPMLFRAALEPFLDNQRADVFWTMHHAEAAAPPP